MRSGLLVVEGVRVLLDRVWAQLPLNNGAFLDLHVLGFEALILDLDLELLRLDDLLVGRPSRNNSSSEFGR